MILFEFFQEVWHNNIRHLPLIGQLTCGFLAFTCLPLLVSVVSISVCILVPMRIISKFTTKWCTCKNRMDGRTVLLTGATSGIGYEAALDLARRGARLILPVRNMEKGKTVSSTISRLTGNKNINLKFMDLANLHSVREFCQSLVAEEARIDVLINNAGNASWEKVIDITDDGLEYQMASNYFGHFLMTNLIIDLVQNAAPSRIINMGSKVHWRSTDLDMDNLNFQRGGAGYWKVYGASKLCMMLFTKELSRKLEDDDKISHIK